MNRTLIRRSLLVLAIVLASAAAIVRLACAPGARSARRRQPHRPREGR